MRSKILVITLALVLILTVGCASYDEPAPLPVEPDLPFEEPEDDFDFLDEEDDLEIESVI